MNNTENFRHADEACLISFENLPAWIRDFYPREPELRDLLFTHSKMVALKALEISRNHPELKAANEFIIEGALLHDIGIAHCDAPGIYCHGDLPYICHGVEGARMLAEKGFLRHARVCERHTGSGLTAKEIEEQALPLPHRDMLPASIEEKIICYADKFYSKTPGSLESIKEKSRIIKAMASHGAAALHRFEELERILEPASTKKC